MMDYQFTEYQNVTLSPLDDGSNKHRLNIRTNPGDVALPHLRGNPRRDIDISVVTFDPLLEARPENVVAGPCLYAGVYYGHFGHFVAECIHRLYMRSIDERLRNAKVVFHVRPLQRIDPWLYPVLDICGVAPEDLILLREPY